MELSIAEVARLRGVSSQRVRVLARSGRLRARRVGGQWLVDPADVALPARVSRPMSARMAWAMCRMLSRDEPGRIDPSEVSRIRSRIAALRASDNPAPQVSSWLERRAPRLRFSMDPGSVEQLRKDPRILLSGVSDPRAQLSAAGEVEGYVAPGDLRDVRRAYLLVEGGEANVIVHVADVPGLMGVDAGAGGRAPLGLVIADLADHHGPREDAQVRRLLSGL
jgi:excisionase family DNA binding protein